MQCAYISLNFYVTYGSKYCCIYHKCSVGLYKKSEIPQCLLLVLHRKI